jgi:hypothetical protein
MVGAGLAFSLRGNATPKTTDTRLNSSVAALEGLIGFVVSHAILVKIFLAFERC